MQSALHNLAVIVPLAPEDRAWTALVADFQGLPPGAEVIFTGPRPPSGTSPAVGLLNGCRLRLSWLKTPLGRARQMNLAARVTSKRFLWFVHADSRLSADGLAALDRGLMTAPDALHYFNLQFDTTDIPQMSLNNVGVWFRSHVLGMPFGDQGLALQRDDFLRLGGFDEQAGYGEDHLLVWKARQDGLRLRCTGTYMTTSPRRYQDRGWLKTTLHHQWLTVKQALPEALKTLRRHR